MTNDETQARKRSAIGRFLPLVVLLAAIGGIYASGLGRYLSLETLAEYRNVLQEWTETRYYLVLGLFALAYVLATALSLPGATMLSITGGFLFGLWVGTGVVVLSATVGATIVFTIAKTALGGKLRGAASGFLDRLQRGFQEDELSYMFILRLVPLFPFFVVNIAPAFLGVRLRNFLIATLFGIIPGAFVFVSVGSGAGEVLDRGETLDLSGLLLQPFFLIPVVGLVLLSLVPILYKRFARRGAATPTGEA